VVFPLISGTEPLSAGLGWFFVMRAFIFGEPPRRGRVAIKGRNARTMRGWGVAHMGE
jgi:hypothetical protein